MTKMNVIALIFALVAVAAAAPQYSQAPKAIRVTRDASRDALIDRYDSDNIGFGYGMETSDGQLKEERGEIVHAGTQEPYLAVQGRFNYTDPDGVMYELAPVVTVA